MLVNAHKCIVHTQDNRQYTQVMYSNTPDSLQTRRSKYTRIVNRKIITVIVGPAGSCRVSF